MSNDSQVQRILAEFERQWKANRSPSIHDFSQQADDPSALLPQLIQREIELRLQRGG